MTAARDTLRRLLRDVRKYYAPPERAKCWRDIADGAAIQLKPSARDPPRARKRHIAH